MGHFEERLNQVLAGYATFLRVRIWPWLSTSRTWVRWVREFLLFARDHGGYTFEQTLDLFLAEVGGRVRTKPWQLQQASEASRIYRYQYRGANMAGLLHTASRVLVSGTRLRNPDWG